MSKHEEKTQETPIEYKIACWLDSFDGHLEALPNVQQHLHDAILSVNNQCYDEKESKVVQAFLNSALSLTFIMRDYPEKIKPFIEYHMKG
jgi:hypothetical protein